MTSSPDPSSDASHPVRLVSDVVVAHLFGRQPRAPPQLAAQDLPAHGAGTFVADGPPVLDTEPLSFLAALHGSRRADMFEARRTLEIGVPVSRRGARAETTCDVQRSDRMFVSIDDPQTFLGHDIRFHRAVAAASGNPIPASIVDMVLALLYEAAVDGQPGGHPRSVAEMHRQIYQTIRAHGRTRAEALMFERLLRAEREQEVEAAGPQPEVAEG